MNLKNAKVGDKVTYAFGPDSRPIRKVASVTRVTRKRIYCDGRQFRKSDGYLIGYGPAECRPLTDEELAALEKRKQMTSKTKPAF